MSHPYNHQPPQGASPPPPSGYQFVPPQGPYGPPPRKKNWFRRHPIWTALILLLAISCIYGALNDTHSSSAPVTDASSATAPVATSEPTQAPSPTPTPRPQTTQQRIESQTLALAKSKTTFGSDFSSRYDTDAKDVTITETITPTDNAGTITQVKSECFDIQQAIWQANIPITSLEIHVVGPLVDQYGKTSTGMIGSCTLDKKTAQQFVWSNLDGDRAWGDYDLTYLLPSLNS